MIFPIEIGQNLVLFIPHLSARAVSQSKLDKLEQGKSNDSVLSLSHDSELMKPLLGAMNYSAEAKWDLTVTLESIAKLVLAQTNEKHVVIWKIELGTSDPPCLLFADGDHHLSTSKSEGNRCVLGIALPLIGH